MIKLDKKLADQFKFGVTDSEVLMLLGYVMRHLADGVGGDWELSVAERDYIMAESLETDTVYVFTDVDETPKVLTRCGECDRIHPADERCSQCAVVPWDGTDNWRY